ncbi:hypothetical protein [Variovorax sp. KK3]|uniref:hypothetical protein n=1 Tax=Variovorax sp. KK3 TaxID=1855728 RepID=UPI00117FC54B|nr:hypothetical protein [Variovorax sp. KK3]
MHLNSIVIQSRAYWPLGEARSPFNAKPTQSIKNPTIRKISKSDSPEMPRRRNLSDKAFELSDFSPREYVSVGDLSPRTNELISQLETAKKAALLSRADEVVKKRTVPAWFNDVDASPDTVNMLNKFLSDEATHLEIKYQTQEEYRAKVREYMACRDQYFKANNPGDAAIRNHLGVLTAELIEVWKNNTWTPETVLGTDEAGRCYAPPAVNSNGFATGIASGVTFLISILSLTGKAQHVGTALLSAFPFQFLSCFGSTFWQTKMHSEAVARFQLRGPAVMPNINPRFGVNEKNENVALRLAENVKQEIFLLEGIKERLDANENEAVIGLFNELADIKLKIRNREAELVNRGLDKESLREFKAATGERASLEARVQQARMHLIVYGDTDVDADNVPEIMTAISKLDAKIAKLAWASGKRIGAGEALLDLVSLRDRQAFLDDFCRKVDAEQFGRFLQPDHAELHTSRMKALVETEIKSHRFVLQTLQLYEALNIHESQSKGRALRAVFNTVASLLGLVSPALHLMTGGSAPGQLNMTHAPGDVHGLSPTVDEWLGFNPAWLGIGSAAVLTAQAITYSFTQPVLAGQDQRTRLAALLEILALSPRGDLRAKPGQPEASDNPIVPEKLNQLTKGAGKARVESITSILEFDLGVHLAALLSHILPPGNFDASWQMWSVPIQVAGHPRDGLPLALTTEELLDAFRECKTSDQRRQLFDQLASQWASAAKSTQLLNRIDQLSEIVAELKLKVPKLDALFESRDHPVVKEEALKTFLGSLRYAEVERRRFHGENVSNNEAWAKADDRLALMKGAREWRSEMTSKPEFAQKFGQHYAYFGAAGSFSPQVVKALNSLIMGAISMFPTGQQVHIASLAMSSMGVLTSLFNLGLAFAYHKNVQEKNAQMSRNAQMGVTDVPNTGMGHFRLQPTLDDFTTLATERVDHLVGEGAVKLQSVLPLLKDVISQMLVAKISPDHWFGYFKKTAEKLQRMDAPASGEIDSDTEPERSDDEDIEMGDLNTPSKPASKASRFKSTVESDSDDSGLIHFQPDRDASNDESEEIEIHIEELVREVRKRVGSATDPLPPQFDGEYTSELDNQRRILARQFLFGESSENGFNLMSEPPSNKQSVK